jgi:hypothetical protein
MPFAGAGNAGEPGDMPAELDRFIRETEQWVQENKRDARIAALKFWMLKGPAIASSALSGVALLQQVPEASAVLSALAAVCVLIDGVQPRGLMRNTLLSAVHDLRALEHEVVSKWRVGSLKGADSRLLAAGILEDAQVEWKKIEARVRDAETAFGEKSRS